MLLSPMRIIRVVSACPEYVRLRSNLGTIDCPISLVDRVGQIYFGFSEFHLTAGRNRTIAIRIPPPLEGRFAIVTKRWARDAVDASARQDELARSGRRNRVVLTPRCWRQVLKKLTLLRDDGDKKARSPRRARRKPLKPLRGECRVNPV
jgi:hypothetical protein